jgi:hypothetical protein
VRMPDSITGTARGSSTLSSTDIALMPMPRPASTSRASTLCRPIIVLRRTGRTAYSTRATTAARNSKPSQNASRTMRPIAGAACPKFATARTPPLIFTNGRRVSRMPRGIAITSTISAETKVNDRCSPISDIRVSALSVVRSPALRSATDSQRAKAPKPRSTATGWGTRPSQDGGRRRRVPGPVGETAVAALTSAPPARRTSRRRSARSRSMRRSRTPRARRRRAARCSCPPGCTRRPRRPPSGPG